MSTNLPAIPDPTGIVDRISNVVDGIYGYPSWLIVALGCLVVGFCLKRWPSFPNEAIPLAVILFGGIFMTMMAPEHPINASALRWKATNFIVGIMIGAGVWLFHNRIWKWIVTRYPILGSVIPGSFNTDFIKKPDVTPPLQVKATPIESAASEQKTQEPK